MFILKYILFKSAAQAPAENFFKSKKDETQGSKPLTNVVENSGWALGPELLSYQNVLISARIF